jgi:hypothetical protein
MELSVWPIRGVQKVLVERNNKSLGDRRGTKRKGQGQALTDQTTTKICLGEIKCKRNKTSRHVFRTYPR